MLFASPTVVVKGKEIKTIRSLVTGKEVRIIGYSLLIPPEANAFFQKKENKGKKIIVEDLNPYIAVEMKSIGGHSGTPFYDEHGRVLILHGALENEGGPDVKDAKEAFRKRYGRIPEGIALLTGTLEILGGK